MMSTRYIYRMTARCPKSLIDDANQLAGVIGESMDDVNTYGAARYEDSEGGLFSVASFQATQGLFEKAGITHKNFRDLVRPIYDENNELDLEAASRVLERLVLIYQPTEESELIEFGPDDLVVFVNFEPSYVIELLNLSIIEEDDI